MKRFVLNYFSSIQNTIMLNIRPIVFQFTGTQLLGLKSDSFILLKMR